VSPTISDGRQLGRMAILHRQLAQQVAGSLARGARPISVAGDCCAAIAVLAGIQRAGVDPLVVWLDAHGDFNTHETTLTGFLGGMPLAMMTGRGDLGLAQSAGLRTLPDGDVLLSDARDLDPAERELLSASGVNRFADPSEILAALPPDRPVYVHLDMDILGPAHAPAMRYSVPGGPSPDSLVSVGEVLRASGRLVAVSVTPWDLAADHDRRTERVCLSVLKGFTGSNA
jgi:arginase